ncbi:hypothetical protein [Pajaroellobacter abortibovis]|uniref:hypothetical protein n=1 Tax=Pajaroellobacter abortibovis TaxID=1882918 RepID=UPI00155FF0D2|nr:hypothetical protein [Pajaroellobacter abortibovis]
MVINEFVVTSRMSAVDGQDVVHSDGEGMAEVEVLRLTDEFTDGALSCRGYLS